VTAPIVRPLSMDDVATVQAIEAAAGQAFREVGMDVVAEDDPPAEDDLAAYVRAGRAWVIEDQPNRPVGYVLVDVLDGAAHVEQVSVHPDAAGRGLGAELIDRVERWARENDLDAVTLTTFRDVPWNGPYYERLGFRVLDETEIGPELDDRRTHEATEGLDPALRVCMRRRSESARTW
jgi:GNAT superfamily N-acetyltransferase